MRLAILATLSDAFYALMDRHHSEPPPPCSFFQTRGRARFERLLAGGRNARWHRHAVRRESRETGCPSLSRFAPSHFCDESADQNERSRPKSCKPFPFMNILGSEQIQEYKCYILLDLLG